jgi:hypothetical protein
LGVGVLAAPDGAMTADSLIEDVTGVTGHGPGRLVTFSSGITYVMSFFAKADTRTWVYSFLDPSRFGGSGYCYFNLGAGTVGSVSAGLNAFMIALPNGWYRCVVIGTSSSTGASNFGLGLATGNGGHNYSGDGASKLYMWGVNLVAEAAHSSYIKTTSATVTRAVDVALIANPEALIDQCWIIRARTPIKLTAGAANTLFEVGAGTNRRTVYYRDGVLTVLVQNGGVTQCSINTAAVANDTDFVLAVRFANNNFAVSLNGGAIVTDLSGTNPVGLTVARVGTISTGGFAWNSTIRRIETRRTASDAELPTLSV